jgi:hypothetical protein
MSRKNESIDSSGIPDETQTEEKKTRKPRTKVIRRNVLSDIDAGVILADSQLLRAKVDCLLDSGLKDFLILHTDRIINTLSKRMKERGGESPINSSLTEIEKGN